MAVLLVFYIVGFLVSFIILSCNWSVDRDRKSALKVLIVFVWPLFTATLLIQVIYNWVGDIIDG